MKQEALLITDTSPLITLAKAGELDVLLKQPLPIQLPDAVYHEAINPKYPDGPQIAEWVIAHPERIQLIPTTAGAEQLALMQMGLKAPHHGEYAAIEAALRHIDNDPQNRALVLHEDDGLRRLQVNDPRVHLLSTGQFLQEMEYARLIPSAHDILHKAELQGRNMERQYQELGRPLQKEVSSSLSQRNIPSSRDVNMEPLQKLFPDQVQNFEYRHRHSDGVVAYEHKETHGRLRIDPEGHTRDNHGARIAPEKALEAALSPAQEKSNGLGKANDSGHQNQHARGELETLT